MVVIESSSAGYELCIYPQESRRKRAGWVMWIRSDGSGVLYTKRGETGAVEGKGYQLPASITRKKQVLDVAV